MVIDKDNIKILLILLIVGLGLGYAYINSDLNINGTAQVNHANWDVHWANVQVSNGSVSAPSPTITNNATAVNFNITLSQPGDYYTFSVDAVNAGAIDAMIESINFELNGVPSDFSNIPPYLEVMFSYADGVYVSKNQELLHDTIETYAVYIGFSENVDLSDLPTTDQTFSFQVGITYKQADDTAQKVRNYLYSFGDDRLNANNQVSDAGQYFFVNNREIFFFNSMEDCNLYKTDYFPIDYGFQTNAQCKQDSVKKIGNDIYTLTSLDNLLADVDDNITFLRYTEAEGYAFNTDVGIYYNNNVYFLYSGGLIDNYDAQNSISIFYERNKEILNSLAGQNNCDEIIEADETTYLCSANNNVYSVSTKGSVGISANGMHCQSDGGMMGVTCSETQNNT